MWCWRTCKWQWFPITWSKLLLPAAPYILRRDPPDICPATYVHTSSPACKVVHDGARNTHSPTPSLFSYSECRVSPYKWNALLDRSLGAQHVVSMVLMSLANCDATNPSVCGSRKRPAGNLLAAFQQGIQNTRTPRNQDTKTAMLRVL